MSLKQAHTAPRPVIAPDLIDRLRAIVGPAGLITERADMAPYLDEMRGLYQGDSPVIVRPASTAEVAAVVRACAAAGAPIVPQGGNTGLCGGAVAQGEVIVSLGRMNKVRAIDPVNFTMTVDAIYRPMPPSTTGCSRCRSAPRGRARSAAISRPMPAALRSFATATRAN